MFFPSLILTNSGRALIVKALNGTAINFTKFALGDGAAPEEPRDLKNLVHLAANMQINSIELSANCAVLESTYTNSGLKSKLVAREIGIFANDPDDGEILYAYANAGNEAAVVPPESGDMTVQETFHMVVAVGDAEQVTATLGEYSGYASKQDLKDHIDDHNNPHHVTAEQVGLGNVPNVTPTNQQPVFSNDYITKTDGSYDVQNIASGEKLGNILRKIRTAIAAFIAHLSAKNPHKISAADISAAAMDHKHNADDVTSGTFPISRGGTGAQTATQALVNLSAMPTSGGTFTGAVRFQQSTYFGTDNSYYVGSDGTANFRKVYGAVYNDYAEWFPRGCDTKPGDIIALDVGSQTERYIKAVGKMDRVVGVHTDEYAYLIGGDTPDEKDDNFKANIEKYIPVSLAGRVRVRVTGRVKTGDLILPSGTPGIGRAACAGEFAPAECIVGYAVEGDDRTDERRIRVRVRG